MEALVELEMLGAARTAPALNSIAMRADQHDPVHENALT